MSLGQLVLELKLDGNEFTVGLKRAEGQLGQFVMNTNRASNSIQRAQKSTQSWGHTIRDVIIGLALARDAVRTLVAVTAGWQKAILGVNGDMQRSIALMKSFSKEVDPIKATAEAVGDVNKLLTRASTAPFTLQAITDTFVKLRVAGVEPVERTLNALVDSVAAFGGSSENLKRAGVAIQQMAGKGVISMEELRQQLGESVPTAINAMADAMGTSYSKLVKQISLGRVSSEPAILAMMRELEMSFKGSAAAMMETWGGAVAQFETGVTRLAAAFGGLDSTGYSENGYLRVMTEELKKLTAVMSSPDMLNSAKEIGKAVAEMVQTVAKGVHWIIQNRDAIYDWGKALLFLWVAFKGASIISTVFTAAGAAMGRLSMQMINMRMASMSVTASLKAQAIAMTGWNSQAAIAAGGATRLATRSASAGTAVRLLGGALGVIAGPIGMVTALAVAGGYAWYEYAKKARDAENAILGLNGALNSQAQLDTLMKLQAEKREDYDEKFSVGEDIIDGVYGSFEAADYRKRRDAAAAEMSKIDHDVSVARVAVAKVIGENEAAAQINQADLLINQMSAKYRINKEKLRDKEEAAAKAEGRKFDNEAFKKLLDQEATVKLKEEIAMYEVARDSAKEAMSKLLPVGVPQETLSDEDMAKFQKASILVGSFTMKIGEAKDELSRAGEFSLEKSLVSADDGDLKTKFDGLKIFVDGMRKKLATLDAKVDETNPYLAQLAATIESLGGKKLPNFDQMQAEGTRLAESMWAQEKARKALTDASKVYGDAMERIGQIESLAKAKRVKVEEQNPWLKASADAQRYEEELVDLIDKMEEAKRAASDAQVEGTGGSRMKRLEDEANKATAAVQRTREELNRLKVSDATRGMTEDSISIKENLMTSSQAIEHEYARRTAWADEFYAENKKYMEKGGADELAYNEYRKQLNAEYMRNTESGLDAWIRQNKDASEKYKSLWGSAMDQFNDTLINGLKNGKFELGSFVEYVLEEILRVQMAKQMAQMAESVSGGGGSGSGWMSAVASVAGAYFGGGGGMGMAAGSAGAASASMGASQAGYSSTYFANGGVMTEYGQLELKKYANGGIANRPQVAIYGEGSMNEAYVPLPDGRTIPVTVSGGGTGGGTGGMAPGPVPVEVNVYNQGGEQQQATSNSQFDGEKMVVDIILRKLSQPGPVRDAVKGV